MRLVPRSLFSRLVLVMLAGLLIAQLASFAVHMHERGEVLAQASGMQAAARIADIVKLLDSVGRDERRRIVRVFSAPPLAIRLGEPPLAPARLDASDRARAALFRTMLQRFLGGAQPVTATVATSGPALETQGPAFMPPGMHARWMHFQGVPSYSFVAQVRLADGSLVTFDSRTPAETADWPVRLLTSLAVLIGGVVGVSLLAVRWTTRPLNALADAADELGKNIDRPPVSEAGPLEVARAAHAFNTMQARLVRYVRERSAALAAISHDLKTPVTRLRLRAELLQDAELKTRIREDLDEMQSMLESTLDFMRGAQDSEPVRPVDINALLESLQADAVLAGSNVALEGSAVKPYSGRPQALKRCLHNLVDNALKYAGSAIIVVEDSADRLVIRVRDRGPGIPEDQLGRVLEPFYRVESSRSRETGGTGLGLSIARSVAELHHGALALGNLPGGGLEAALTLPRQ